MSSFLSRRSGDPKNPVKKFTKAHRTGLEEFADRLEWDPRPYEGDLTDPALSPDGYKLAVIRKGRLEVFDIQ